MDDVWMMALSLVIGCLVLVWLLLYVRLGKSVIQNGGGRSFVNERRPPLIRNGKCALQSTNGAHRAQASECTVYQPRIAPVNRS